MIVEHAEAGALKICYGKDHEPNLQCLDLDGLSVELVLCKECLRKIESSSLLENPESFENFLRDLGNLPDIPVCNNAVPLRVVAACDTYPAENGQDS